MPLCDALTVSLTDYKEIQVQLSSNGVESVVYKLKVNSLSGQSEKAGLMTVLQETDQPDKSMRDRWLLLLEVVKEYNQQYRVNLNPHTTVRTFFKGLPDS